MKHLNLRGIKRFFDFLLNELKGGIISDQSIPLFWVGMVFYRVVQLRSMLIP